MENKNAEHWTDIKVKHNVLPLIPLGFEPRTSRVLGERDNHYTMESALLIVVRHPYCIWNNEFVPNCPTGY